MRCLGLDGMIFFFTSVGVSNPGSLNLINYYIRINMQGHKVAMLTSHPFISF